MPETGEGGAIQNYAASKEDGYPVGLCDAVAGGIRRRRAALKDPRANGDIAFTEVFSGAHALLSARVARHVAVGLASSSTCSSSCTSALAGQ